MALTMPAISPAFSPGAEETPRANSVSFEDGYELRMGDGLNPITTKVTIPWRALTIGELELLLGFFRHHKGTDWFWWTIPGEPIPRQFVAMKWNWERTANAKGRYDLSVEMKQVFDFQ